MIELLITMVISGIIMAAVYAAYTVQRKTYEAQDQITEMQQNIRAALWYMVPDIRMAGYDPTEKAKAKIRLDDTTYYTKKNRISFSLDLNEDGDTKNVPLGNDPNENVAYGFSDTDDPNFDGVIAGSSAAELGRNVNNSGFQPFADNISAIEFQYVLVDGTKVLAPNNFQATRIRAVEISILARAKYPDRNFTNQMTYTTASGATWGPYNDNFRRLLLTATVQCRNLGLH